MASVAGTAPAWHLYVPKLVTVLRQGYGAPDLRHDLVAGLTVAIVALPLAMALAIADRESHFEPHAYNPSGCAGIYQHQLRYWPGRAAAYGFRGWSAFNARANIMVTMRMVHLSGWGPWAL